jgi:hypothetical protein
MDAVLKALRLALFLFPSVVFAAATPSPNLNDQQILAGDITFQSRVLQSLISTCNSIANEAISTTMPFILHIRRSEQCNLMLVPANLNSWKTIIAEMVATDALVIGDATVAGATPLTTGNVAAQAALVTDAHISTAISSQFNTLLVQH